MKGEYDAYAQVLREEGRQVRRPLGHSVIRTGVLRKSVVTKGGLLFQPRRGAGWGKEVKDESRGAVS